MVLVHYEALRPFRVYEFAPGSWTDLSVANPVARIQARFARELGEARGADGIRSIDAPRHPARGGWGPARRTDPLTRTFGTGWALDFDTTEWRLWGATFQTLYSEQPAYRLQYVALARLVRIESGEVAWQQSCMRDASPRPRSEFAADDWAPLQRDLDAQAEACAAELYAAFAARFAARGAAR